MKGLPGPSLEGMAMNIKQQETDETKEEEIEMVLNELFAEVVLYNYPFFYLYSVR